VRVSYEYSVCNVRHKLRYEVFISETLALSIRPVNKVDRYYVNSFNGLVF